MGSPPAFSSLSQQEFEEFIERVEKLVDRVMAAELPQHPFVKKDKLQGDAVNYSIYAEARTAQTTEKKVRPKSHHVQDSEERPLDRLRRKLDCLEQHSSPDQKINAQKPK